MSIRGEEVLNSKGRKKGIEEEKKKQHLEKLSAFMRIEQPEWSPKVRLDRAHVHSLNIWQYLNQEEQIETKDAKAINNKNIMIFGINEIMTQLLMRLTFRPLAQVEWNVSERNNFHSSRIFIRHNIRWKL